MNFDLVARVYDRLAYLVFGKSWIKVQLTVSGDLNQHKKVLILGGGTGRILSELKGLEITYLELSDAMIQRAKKKTIKSKIDWVQTDFITWRSDQKYDAVYCPFFLDVFPELELDQVVRKIKQCLEDDGSLYVVDFQKGNLFQRALTHLMLLFFRVFSGLKSKQLLDINATLGEGGFFMQSEKTYYGQWVFRRSYIKSII